MATTRRVATATFFSPMSAVAKIVCRWRFVSSTSSSSTIAIRPTPAAARYCSTGDPRPPAPTTRTRAAAENAPDRPGRRRGSADGGCSGAVRARSGPREQLVQPLQKRSARVVAGVGEVARSSRRSSVRAHVRRGLRRSPGSPSRPSRPPRTATADRPRAAGPHRSARRSRGPTPGGRRHRRTRYGNRSPRRSCSAADRPSRAAVAGPGRSAIAPVTCGSAAAVSSAVIAPMLCPTVSNGPGRSARACATTADIWRRCNRRRRAADRRSRPSLWPGKSRLKTAKPWLARKPHMKSRLMLARRIAVTDDQRHAARPALRLVGEQRLISLSRARTRSRRTFTRPPRRRSRSRATRPCRRRRSRVSRSARAL